MSEAGAFADTCLERLRTAWSETLRDLKGRGTPQPREYLWASQIRACTRAMALDMLHPEDNAIHENDEALARVQRGTEREESVVDMLRRAGRRSEPPFEVIGQQNVFEVKDRDGTLLIRGRTDGRLRFSSGYQPIFEVKSGESWRRVERVDDLDRSPWTRHGLDQLLCYLYSQNEPDGLLIVDKPGLPTLLPVRLERYLERVEGVLQRAREAVVCVRTTGATLPPYHDDVEACLRCAHFNKTCMPDNLAGAGVELVLDDELEEACRIVADQGAAVEAFDAAKELLRARFKAHGRSAIVGDFEVRVSFQRQTGYELPADVEQEIRTLKEPYRVTQPTGRMRMVVQRINGDAAKEG